ncbi:hypothetical protein [Rhizobium leguminosarum]|uniref:hypothetical protein n=1 Tax=Rhizobium leguminosarum TaxID=384 RepID=UPI001C97E371|nr:hypothetical protein [Rhizobium leguminosarum]MBY5709701.1 hypothetical protein [Rhizobium leguminosarum]
MAIKKITCTADDFSRLATQLSAAVLADIAFVGDGVEVSEERYDEILAALNAGVPDSLLLDAVKAELKAGIDKAAEEERVKYITPGAGQAMTYLHKADQARRYVAAAEPVDSEYPLLAAEVGITASSIAGVAAVVIAAFENWQDIGGLIEAARLGTKKAVEIAQNEADARAAAAAVTWP